MKHASQRRYLILLSLVILLAIFLRTYHMHELSIFIADQAIIGEEVLKILRGNLTLLGTSTSIAPLYFGPIMFYLSAPFYALFDGYPLAGTVFQTTLQILSVPFVFLIGKKVKNEQVGLLAAFLFAISGLFVEYSRAAFNTTTALSISTVIIYLFFSILSKYKSWKVLLMGILLGFVFQINFITVSICIAIGLFPLFFYRKLVTFKYYAFLIAGFLIGFSPYILFEVKHNFLNTNEMIKYLFYGGSGKSKSLLFMFIDIPVIVSQLLYGIKNIWLGSFSILFMIVGTVMIFKKKEGNIFFKFLLFLLINAFVISIIYGRHLETIYLISIHTALIIIFSFVFFFFLRKYYALMIVSLLIIFCLNMPTWNLQKPIHDLQDGLHMSDFEKADLIIQNDRSDGDINVAMDAQRDNRAMPLRYFLFLNNIPYLGYADYDKADELYFIVRKTKNLQNITIWEYRSFGPNEVVTSWEINDLYIMYKLKKVEKSNIAGP